MCSSDLIQILFPRWPAAVRTVLSGCVLAMSLGLSAQLAESEAYDRLALAAVPLSLVLAVFVRAVRSPRPAADRGRPVRTGLGIAAAGVALLALASVRHGAGLDDQIERDADDMALMTFTPERESDDGRLFETDRGRSFPAWRTKTPMTRGGLDERERRTGALLNLHPDCVLIEPASDATNCHGWVFAGGRAIVTNADVETILADNDYRIVGNPAPGDLAIYRNGIGAVAHTAIVRSAEPNRPVIVEGKWGWMGVYRHAVADSNYGNDYAFYRTARPDHIVKFLDRTAFAFGGAE